jgi:hypothetical protein
MIDLEHCTVLGNESIDANSLNRCMFNLHRKMMEASERTVGSESENIPNSPFFSGGHENILAQDDSIPEYIRNLDATSADAETEGLVARLYSGDLNIYGSQDNQSFATESETGTYFYSAEQLSTFAPSVSSLFNQSSPFILRSILTDDESTMASGVSSLGIASSPIVKFTSYLTCSKSGVSFGTVTFKRNNGDQQDNVITLNIIRDLIGIDGVDSVDFFTIGNGFSSGVRTVSESLDMVSDIGQCTVTYLSDNNVAISNITKSDNGNYIKVDRDTGRIVDNDDETFGKYIELSNDEVVLNFFTMFTLKDDVVKYSDDLWCFYIVNDESYGRNVLNDATAWARDYFRYSFDNFLAADNGKLLSDGAKVPTYDGGCTLRADDAFNGCYNATFKSLCWISPSLRYAERMFKGCTHATFDSLPNILHFQDMRSAVSMFEDCMEASFSNIESIELPTASKLASMFEGCSNATFDKLATLTINGDASRMFYGDYSSDFLSLTGIDGDAVRLISMFEGCDNAEFPLLEHISSGYMGAIDASRMFYGLKVPTFEKIESIELSPDDPNSVGYDGVSMFEGCLNAKFESLTSLGNVVDGTRMFCGCDPKKLIPYGENKSTFEHLTSLGKKLVYGNEMFRDNYFLTMDIKDVPESLADGTSMFQYTSTVRFDVNLPSLVTAQEMFSLVDKAVVNGNMPELVYGEKMFAGDVYAAVNGDMDKLVNANGMFTNSDTVYVKSFPGSVEDALNSFSDITGSCTIDSWEAATNDRIADNCFSHSKNVWIKGNIIAGKVVSTSHMFDSANNVTIYNERMATAETEEQRERARFFSTESGENFVYLQRMSSDSLSGEFTLVGNSAFDELSSYLSSTFETSSLVVAATLKTNDLKYDIYSVGDDGTELLTNEFSFDDPSTLEFSADYSYAKVDGYTVAAPATSMLAIRRNTGVFETETESVPFTSFYLYNSRLIDGTTTDNRLFILSAYEGNVPGFHFEQYRGETITELMLSEPPTSTPQMWGNVYYDGGYKLFVYPGGAHEETGTSYKSFFFDFIQLESDDYSKSPKLVVGWENEDGEINRYAIDVPNSGNPSIVSLYKSDYPKLMLENSKDDINVRIINVRKYGEPEDSDPYGYLMQYHNRPYKDYRMSLHVCNGEYGIPQAMYRCPKGYVGDYTVAQIFSDHRFEDDVPFGLGSYGVSSLESSDTTRVRTRFSIGNADMGGFWKDADHMFYNVVEDSLLSGYYCFSDVSLEDTSYMFALDEYFENDQTFSDSGPLMQNLGKSRVSSMDGMFRNRCVVNPTVFEDLYYDGVDENDTYISFQIPVSAESASASFFNCHISSTTAKGKEYKEIGLYMPLTLVMADDMFNGYQGPSIRFGYNSNGKVYIADGFSGERMFNGCLFTNSPSEKFGLDIPTIYLNMFEGSNFSMNNISSIHVRNGLNFANPYSDETFFYNDVNFLGCSSITFDSLETDVLDWFCTDTSDVEGVYLATVIGPKNGYDETTEPPALTADYRLMTAERRDGTWSNPRMSDKEQFTDEMVSKMYDSTNNLRLNMMREFENHRGRATCMFNPSILFKYSYLTLGDLLSSNLGHENYETVYGELTNDAYIGSTYNQMEFGLVKTVNAVEMPFAFAGLSSATFDSLSSVGTSAINGYGAFMNCTAATFDSLRSISFMQNGLNQTESFSSRFSTTADGNWYGNYCNMFAGCSSASMSSLESILLNSEYSVYGKNKDRVLTWFDVNGDINYMTYSSFTSRFSFSFDATTASYTFKMAISDSGFNKFFDYDTEIPVSEISSVDVRFRVPTLGSDDVLSIVEVNKLDEPEAFRFFIDTAGNVTNLSDARFIDNYAIELSGDIYNVNCNKTYFVTDTMSAHGIEPTEEQLKDSISKKAKFLLLYRNATGYHSIEVDENYMFDINYRVTFSEVSGDYWINIYDNNTIDYQNRINSQWLSGVKVDDSCEFKMEMTEVNDEFTPILTITDAHNDEYIYEILADGTVRRLEQHPERGVVTKLGGFAKPLPFFSDGRFTVTSYSDSYGQNYDIVCSSSDSVEHAPEHYVMRLSTSDKEIAELHTPISSSEEASSVRFTIGTYLSNGADCIIVGIADGSGNNVYYKIYKGRYFPEYKDEYSYVEQTEYDPAQRLDYKLLSTIRFGNKVAVAHKAYCSGMFMHEPAATFGKLDTISLPAIGSCAGMFSDVFGEHSYDGSESMLLSSLKYMVLPRTDRSDRDGGYLDYRGIFSGVPVSSVDLGGLVEAHTNIYALGQDGNKTRGYELFYGMLDNGDLTPFDDEFHMMTKEIAVNSMNLDSKIADRMIWNNGMLELLLDVRNAGETFNIAVQPLEGESVTIDWGDGEPRTVLEGLSHTSLTKVDGHEYETPGTYTVRVTDTISRFVVGDYQSYDDESMKESVGNKTDSLVVGVKSFGDRMTDVSFAFAACSRLLNTCGWNCEDVKNVAYCYYGCDGLTTPMSKWADYTEHCEYCYYGCSSMTQTFSDDIYELMPIRMLTFKDCVYGSSEAVRARFFVDWGGSATETNSTVVVIHVEEGE